MRNHVSNWEDLPDGEWLDNDEYGVNWYLANDGNYWHSVEDGFRVWEEKEIKKVENEYSYHYEKDDLKEIPLKKRKNSPKIESFTAVIGVLMASFVLMLTLSGSIPENDYNIDTLRGTLSDGELDNVQTLHYVIVGLSGATIIVSFLTMLKASKWWLLSFLNVALIILLMYTANLSATIYDSIWGDGSIFYELTFYSGVCGVLGLLLIGKGTISAWMNFEPDDEFDDYYDGSYDDDEEVEELPITAIVVSFILMLVFGGVGYLIYDAIAGTDGNQQTDDSDCPYGQDCYYGMSSNDESYTFSNIFQANQGLSDIQDAAANYRYKNAILNM
tara:strand:+ start:544 stop:1533 length:990 start_codon:yes stop_codon:yes gene_type:complete